MLISVSCLYTKHPIGHGPQAASSGGGPPGGPPQLLTATPEQLNARIISIYDAVHSFQMKATMTARDGSVYRSTAVTEIHEGINSIVLFEKPATIRIRGNLSLVGTMAFDMVSTGTDFRLSLPMSNLFVEGANASPPLSKNALENFRPDEFLSALLISPAGETEKLFLQDDTDVDHSYSILQLVRIEAGERIRPNRAVWFDRLNLQIVRQILFDNEGLIVSDTRYQKWQNENGASFAAHIDMNFKKDGYGVSMDVVDMQMNPNLTDDKFVLERPQGTTLKVIGAKAGSVP